MEIHRLQLLSGARQAMGLAVAIDVLRASSHVVTLFAKGAERVVPVASVAEARTLKMQHPDWILAGERHGLPPEGFDLGNSPFEAAQRDFHARTVVLTTSAGSRGLVAALESAEEVVVGCFLNASAVTRYARRRNAATVSLLALGVAGETPSPEDDGAALLIESLLRGRSCDLEQIFASIRQHPEGQKFLDPQNPNYMAEDLEACLRLDIHDIVPRMSPQGLRL